MNELKLSHFQNVSVELKFPTSHNIMHVTLYIFILMLIIYLSINLLKYSTLCSIIIIIIYYYYYYGLLLSQW